MADEAVQTDFWQQVVINCGRGTFLDEPLMDYFAVADNITLFAEKLVVKLGAQNPYRQLLGELAASEVQQLVLDFDLLVMCK